jgi:hypothetical protein
VARPSGYPARGTGKHTGGGWDATKGETVTSQVIMEDGSENPLSDHLREAHRKGTRGLTDEYLASLHRTLHQRKREPQPEYEFEHEHPDDDTEYTEYPEHGAEYAQDDAPASA